MGRGTTKAVRETEGCNNADRRRPGRYNPTAKSDLGRARGLGLGGGKGAQKARNQTRLVARTHSREGATNAPARGGTKTGVRPVGGAPSKKARYTPASAGSFRRAGGGGPLRTSGRGEGLDRWGLATTETRARTKNAAGTQHPIGRRAKSPLRALLPSYFRPTPSDSSRRWFGSRAWGQRTRCARVRGAARGGRAARQLRRTPGTRTRPHQGGHIHPVGSGLRRRRG